jgi:CRISPR/Cas system-associated exonuclease Cas4 (RecB family)
MAYSRERSHGYQPGQSKPFRISRSKIELFMQCPRCFWLDVRLKITRPSSPPFNINKAIDELFKKEFDTYRTQGKPHPIMSDNQIKAIPYAHEELNTWRTNFTGVSTEHIPTNLHIFGAVDDVWIGNDGQLIVVDYKATSKNSSVNLDAEWQISYKRQMEIYQWLLRQNGFSVSNVGYFVYTNARLDLEGFNDHLEFHTKLIPYKGSDAWIEPTLAKIKQCMDSEDMPAVGEAAMGGPCEFCTYARARTELTIQSLNISKNKNKSSLS